MPSPALARRLRPWYVGLLPRELARRRTIRIGRGLGRTLDGDLDEHEEQLVRFVRCSLAGWRRGVTEVPAVLDALAIRAAPRDGRGQDRTRSRGTVRDRCVLPSHVTLRPDLVWGTRQTRTACSRRAWAGELTAAQRFFYAYAHSWCAAQTGDDRVQMLAEQPHAPAPFRVNGPLSHLPGFAEAFGCAPGDAMVRPESSRCEVW